MAAACRGAFDYGRAMRLEAQGTWREWLGEADHALLAPWVPSMAPSSAEWVWALDPPPQHRTPPPKTPPPPPILLPPSPHSYPRLSAKPFRERVALVRTAAGMARLVQQQQQQQHRRKQQREGRGMRGHRDEQGQKEPEWEQQQGEAQASARFKVVVARALQQVGCEGATDSALGVLTDLLAHRLRQMGRQLRA
ncbi:hypothetical protein CLOP_g14284, partial [Closterium sp. NIES-67]